MKSRVLGIKKSTILRAMTFFCVAACIFLIFFSIFYMKNYYLWFFIFSFFVGIVVLTKGVLFKTDSALYLGFALSNLGIAGFCAYFFELDYKYFYILSAFGMASIETFFFTHQKFQFFVGLLLCATTIVAFLYSNKIINLAIFLVIYLSFLFIFSTVCVILLMRHLRIDKEDDSV